MEQPKDEPKQENWSGTTDHTKSLEIRLNQRRKVSSAPQGQETLRFVNTLPNSSQLVPAQRLWDLGTELKAGGGGPPWAGEGWQEQSRAHRRQLLPAPPATHWDCNGQFCPTGQTASSSALPRSVNNTQAEILFICLNPHRPKTNKHTENAEELNPVTLNLISMQLR